MYYVNIISGLQKCTVSTYFPGDRDVNEVWLPWTSRNADFCPETPSGRVYSLLLLCLLHLLRLLFLLSFKTTLCGSDKT